MNMVTKFERITINDILRILNCGTKQFGHYYYSGYEVITNDANDNK